MGRNLTLLIRPASGDGQQLRLRSLACPQARSRVRIASHVSTLTNIRQIADIRCAEHSKCRSPCARINDITTAFYRSMLALCATLLVSPLVTAADTPPPPHHGPPPEAIAACKGKAVGASVSFTGRHGETMTGTCESINGVLAARPANMPPPPGASGPAR